MNIESLLKEREELLKEIANLKHQVVALSRQLISQQSQSTKTYWDEHDYLPYPERDD